MKHFEELWEKAEETSLDYYLDEKDAMNEIQYALEKILADKDLEMHFGELLFGICYLSKSKNVDVFPALKNALEETIESLYELPTEVAIDK